MFEQIKNAFTGDDKPIKVGKYNYYKLGDKLVGKEKVTVWRAMLIPRNKYIPAGIYKNIPADNR